MTAAEAKIPHSGEVTLRVLLVEDSPADAEMSLHELRRGGFDISSDIVQTIEDFTQQVRANPYQLILADYNLPQWRGIETLEVLRREGLDIPVILVSGSLGDIAAVECIKQGATDYVLKDSLARLPASARRALQEKRQRDHHQKAEQDLARKVEELGRSNRDLEQFAYVASHDLQEPLRMVAAYTQLLAERYRGKLDANADKYIGYAVEGAVRMQALVRDMLTFSRVGHNGNHHTNVDCNSALTEAWSNLGVAVEGSGATITHDPLPTLNASRTRLVQLFQNLIANAIKFRTKEKPVIRVSAKRQGEEWAFAVADNGIGIAPEHKDVVFVIFQRLNARDEYDGNGLGLAICQKIVEQHGGKIWVESESGQGSIFRFTLSAHAADKTCNTHDLHTCDSVGR